jgi:threonine dehydrogenase-like Zn-dependent dehydrogenase
MERRLLFPEPNRIELEAFETSSAGPGEIRVRSILSLISPGTELRCLSGEFAPGTHWDNWIRYPFKPGYSLVARDEQGQRGFVRESHGSAHVIPGDKFFPIPDEVDDLTAAFSSVAMIGAMVLHAGQITLESRVLILGAGLIGQMATRWCRAAGAHVTLVDPIEGRLEFAPADSTLTSIESVRAPVVIDTTGSPAVFRQALAATGDHGIMVLLGDVGDPSQQGLTPDVILRGVRVHGAHMMHERPGWTEGDIYRKYWELTASGRFSVKELVTHRLLPGEAEQGYAMLRERSASAMGVLIDWGA